MIKNFENIFIDTNYTKNSIIFLNNFNIYFLGILKFLIILFLFNIF
jgi:hypothetical protein